MSGSIPLIRAGSITPFIGWDAVLQASLVLLALGVGLAMVTAFLTLRRYLRV
mgnify:CR=1 FL=1